MSKELANGDMTTISAERGSVRWREITSEIPLGLGTNLVKQTFGIREELY